MDTREAIKNLELISCAFEKTAKKSQNYNSELSYYLEQISWSLHKHADDLRELEYLFGVSQEEGI